MDDELLVVASSTPRIYVSGKIGGINLNFLPLNIDEAERLMKALDRALKQLGASGISD